MEPALTQVFPRREGSAVTHRTWSLDVEAARPVAERSGLDRERLAREAREMVEHFPRWLLTVQVARDVHLCARCRGMLVFDRGVRCAVCDRAQGAPPGATLAWFGSMPPIGIDGLARVRHGMVESPPERHVVGRRDGIGTYVLVPLVAAYPAGFPAVDLHVSYLPGIFRVPGFPPEAASHACHLLERGRMCLFAPGQWNRATTCREVLQQRAYAHVIKLLNYANGKTDAFAIVS